MPLTFLDHRLVCGDSLTGPFVEYLTTYPCSGEPMEGLFAQRLGTRLGERLGSALTQVRELELTIGTDVADVEQKRAAKARLDAALAPFETLAAAWGGGVMLGAVANDADYEALAKAVAAGTGVDPVVATRPTLRRMVATGREGLSYDLAFPEVFHPGGAVQRASGFDAVVGNPPWDALQPLAKEFFASFDLRVLDAPTSEGCPSCIRLAPLAGCCHRASTPTKAQPEFASCI